MRKYIYSTISFIVLAIPVIFLISELYAFRPDGFLVNFIAENIVSEVQTEALGYSFVDVGQHVVLLLSLLSIALLILSYIYIIILLLISDITKISIHWLIKSVILAGLIILINYYFLNTTLYMAADFISAKKAMLLNLFTLIYYLLLLNLILITNKLFR